MVPPGMLACPSTAEPVVEPVEDEAPRAVPPQILDEIPDGLSNDDLLEERLLKKM